MKLIIDRVSKSFKNKKALGEINLELTTGVYGILGENGSGKTTLMRILASVMQPSSGRVLLNEKDITVMDHEYRDLIGYLPQHVGLYKSFTAEKFLKYIGSLKGLPKDELNEKVSEVLSLVGLSTNSNTKLGEYSGGMKQRIGIAQALLNNPKILIVDEPTAGLDPKERIRFRNLLSKISTNRIVILSTHIVSDIEFIAKEVIILREGQLIKKASPQQLLSGIKNKVWSVLAEEHEIASLQEKYKIGNITRVQEKFQLRLLSDDQPFANARSEAPNLEDLYLHYFDKEVSA